MTWGEMRLFKAIGGGGCPPPRHMVLFLCLFSFGMGLSYLPLPGLQYDEILFLHPYLNDWSLFRARIEDISIPLMLMSYVGALKTLLYWPLYHWLPPSVWTVRLPMLLLSCVNVWLIFRLGRRLWSPRAGVLAAALAATDPTLALTQLFDWGPVTIQVFLSLSAALSFLAWRSTANPWRLALCGLCCGLALWNKAIFVWVLMAVGVAAIVCWPRILFTADAWRRALGHWRTWLWASLAFLVGASPFIAYNLKRQASTVTDNAQFEDTFPFHKLSAMAASLDGHLIASGIGFSSVWMGHCSDGVTQQLALISPLPETLQWLPEATLTPYALFAAAMLLLWQWRKNAARIGLFLLLVFLIHCALAIMSRNGGTGLHHYAPVLPLVFLTIGGAWHLACSRATGNTTPGGAIRHRWLPSALLAVAILLPIQSAITLGAWQQRVSSCGDHQLWTHTSEALAAHVRSRPEQRFHVTDWGIDPQANYFGRKRGFVAFMGVLNLEPATEGPQYEEVARLFADPATRLVSYRPGAEVIPSHRETLDKLLAIHHYRLIEELTILDRKGRPVYWVWKLETATNEHGSTSSGSSQ